jgi:phosphoribosyl 1,2-cyclic phosphodiesterase
MRFASIGSGSRGNATVITHQSTSLLVDCGFSARETEKRLERLKIQASQLSGILVTHEHSDHISGVRVLAQKHQIPVYATPGTAGCLAAELNGLIHEFNCHESFFVKDVDVQPFPVPHDAREPSQFVFSDGDKRLGLLTDVGSLTPLIEETLSGCHALMLEANHDMEMLQNGVYPEHLKQRVGGRFGHLNNVQSATLLKKIDTSNLQHLIAMHISEKNNDCEIVRPLLAEALGCEQSWVNLAEQDGGFGWRELSNN